MTWKRILSYLKGDDWLTLWSSSDYQNKADKSDCWLLIDRFDYFERVCDFAFSLEELSLRHCVPVRSLLNAYHTGACLYTKYFVEKVPRDLIRGTF